MGTEGGGGVTWALREGGGGHMGTEEGGGGHGTDHGAH